MLDSIEFAVEQIRVGRPIIVVDERRENEGDLTLAACHATPELTGMMVRYGSGVICVPVPDSSLDRLRLPPMTAANEDDAALPTRYGEFRAIGYRSTADGKNIDGVALVRGDLNDGQDVLVRVHSGCLTGDVLTSERCDCGEQLAAAFGRGVLLYMHGHEGPGSGLVHKLQTYQLQDSGHDTVDANVALGFPADAPDYGTTAQILVDLGVRSIGLLTKNPAKRVALEEPGIHVSGREPLQVPAQPASISYLRAKRDRLGHLLTDLDAEAAPMAVAATPHR